MGALGEANRVHEMAARTHAAGRMLALSESDGAAHGPGFTVSKTLCILYMSLAPQERATDAVERAGENTLGTSPVLSMKEDLIGGDDLIATFAQQRQRLLKHTADILCSEGTPVRQPVVEREAKLSAILVSSLEQLKVAEEELIERTQALAEMRGDLEDQVYGARMLFDLAPACLILTDMYGNIVDANRAAQSLFKRDRAALERQPLARFIAPDDRRAFREALARVAETDGVKDWRLELVRPTAVPVRVSIALQVLKETSPSKPTRFYWSIRPLDSAEAPADA